MSERRYESASVLISGAARGFGRLAAEKFASEGARLILTDILEKELEETAGAARSLGAETIALPGDIAGELLPQELVEAAASRFGRAMSRLTMRGSFTLSASSPISTGPRSIVSSAQILSRSSMP